MERLSLGQRKALSEFFTNAAVAWLSAGIIIPFFANRRIEEFIALGLWGLFFSLVFITISLFFTKGVNT
jgi:hypothetical protein